TPKIKEWVPFLQENMSNPDEETHFVGHSIGCQTILRYLETLSEKTKVGMEFFQSFIYCAEVGSSLGVS
ncbi:MAG: hypothetical protein US53_C0024G0012, partial [Candidatus Woesebacteria bacterium GW2011_GWA1_37_7]